MSQSPERSPRRYSPKRSYSRSPSSGRRGRSYTPDGRGGGEPITTIYVGGISFDTDERTLQNYFEKFGVVLETKVVIDRETGRSKGYGFVKFDDPRDASDAITSCHGKLLDGRTIRCNLAKYNPGGRGGLPGGGGYNDRGPPDHGPGRGYGGRGDFGPHGGRGGGRGFDDGFYGGGRGRGGRFDGGRGRGRFDGGGYGRGGPPPGPYPPERTIHHDASFSPDGRALPTKRRRSVSGSPAPTPREGRHKHRRPAAGSARRSSRYSSSPSGSSYSRSASRSASRSPHRAAAANAASQDVVALKKDLGTSQRQTSELQQRVAALEAQAKASSSARGTLTDQLAEMQASQQRAEATHKLYRRWMSALLESSQALLEGKEEVAAAEAELAQRQRDLGQLLVEADSFLSEERRERRKAAKKAGHEATDGGDAVAAEAVLAADPSAATMNGTAPPLPAADAPGGWQEAADAAALPPVETGSRFAPGTKFTITT